MYLAILDQTDGIPFVRNIFVGNLNEICIHLNYWIEGRNTELGTNMPKLHRYTKDAVIEWFRCNQAAFTPSFGIFE